MTRNDNGQRDTGTGGKTMIDVVTYQLAYLSHVQVDLCDECAERGDHGLGSLGPVQHGAHRGECEGKRHGAYCENCGWLVPAEGVSIDPESDLPRAGAKDQRCADTACISYRVVDGQGRAIRA
jgi:hypothetical protein